MTEEHEGKKTTVPLTGLTRIYAAFGNSMTGLRFAVTSETSFRQEVFFFIILLPVLIWLPVSLSFKAILFLANCLVLITELFNSSLESVVDLASPDHHTLAGRAKDLASAAVLISLLASAALWVVALSSLIQQD